MKICVINSLFSPHAKGGAEVVVERLVKEYSSRGHEVIVVTSASFSHVQFGFERRQEKNSIVYRVFNWNFLWIGAQKFASWPVRMLAACWGLLNFIYAWRVRQILLDERPDIVHTHNLFGTSFLIPFLIRSLKIPHIHTLHDVQLAIPSGRLRVGEEFAWKNIGLPARVYQYLQKKLWGSPDIVTAPSEWLIRYYRKMNFFPRSRMEVVRHGFGFSCCKNFDAAARRAVFTIAYIGQIEREKGVRMAAEAFIATMGFENARDVEFLIVGAGSDEPCLQMLSAACPRLHLIGRVDTAQVRAVLNTADVVIVPSLIYENSPTIILEAMAYGVPVSVSDVGGAAELVREFKNGWVIEPREDAWRVHVQWLLANREEVSQARFNPPEIQNSGESFLEIFLLLQKKMR